MEKISFENYRFRASEIGNLIAGSSKGMITDKQRQELALLIEKRDNGKGLTARQEVRLKELQEKEKAMPKLSEGAKNFLKRKVREIIYNRKREVYSKYFDKGNFVESESISILNSAIEGGLMFPFLNIGKPVRKNEYRFSNDYVEGTPDIIFDTRLVSGVLDIKSSWDFQTFPLMEEKPDFNYIWQVKAYLWLVFGSQFMKYADKNLNGYVVYVLTNTPEHLILDEIRRWAWSNNVIDVPEEMEKEIRRLHTYDDVPLNLRIKSFPVFINEDDVKLMKYLIEEARQYMREIYQKIEEDESN